MALFRTKNLIFLGLATTALSGCAANDRFSGSAVRYNLEAEQVQDQGIVLNVLRASKRRPFEFSGLQTVTGATSASGQVGFSIPLAQNGSMTASTFSPTVTQSGGPTVTVGVVDTQDFYSGLLKPESTQIIDLYVRRGLPRVMLFDLFFSRIDATQKADSTASGSQIVRHAYVNTVTDRAKFDTFQKLVVALVKAKLTTEQIDKPKAFGVPMTAEEIISQRNYVPAAAAAGLEVKNLRWCDLSNADRMQALIRLRAPNKKIFDDECKALKTLKPSETKAEEELQGKIAMTAAEAHLPAALYRVQKSGSDTHLCFEDAAASSVGLTTCDSFAKDEKADEAPTRTLLSFSSVGKTGDATSNLCNALNADAGAAAAFDCGPNANPVSLSFTIRSTYGIIYYLGEVVRRQIDKDSFATATGTVDVYVGDDLTTPVPLFVLERDADPDAAFLSTSYDGHSYSIPSAKDQTGMTFEVLDLVAELTALNKSAKDLPATSVITAVP